MSAAKQQLDCKTDFEVEHQRQALLQMLYEICFESVSLEPKAEIEDED